MTNLQTGPGTPLLSEEEIATIQAHAEALEKSIPWPKIHVVVQVHPQTFKRVITYLKEPNYTTKIRVMDKASTHGAYTAAEELRQGSVLKDESDPLAIGDAPECDVYKIGCVEYCIEMISRISNQFKKN